VAPAAPVIAIDGPTGSGKGTISRALARRLGWSLLDSGALYRLVALAAARAGVAAEDKAGLVKIAHEMDIRFSAASQDEQIWLDGAEVSAALRSEEAGRGASRVAVLAEVRQALLERQRGFAVPPGLVADGRDMGTVVFPDAALKVFLTADPNERAERRYKQLREKGIDVSLAALSREIVERDRRDSSRPVAPLRPAADARVLDSTGLTAEETTERVLAWVRELGLAEINY
jgi:cytidylate kinase